MTPYLCRRQKIRQNDGDTNPSRRRHRVPHEETTQPTGRSPTAASGARVMLRLASVVRVGAEFALDDDGSGRVGVGRTVCNPYLQFEEKRTHHRQPRSDDQADNQVKFAVETQPATAASGGVMLRASCESARILRLWCDRAGLVQKGRARIYNLKSSVPFDKR